MTTETKDATADAMIKVYLDPDQLKKDLDFNAGEINEEMRRHSSIQNHYANQATYARAQSDRWESAVEILESQLDSHYRKVLKEESPKTTEQQIRSAIVTDTRWRNATARKHDALTQWKLCENAARSFEHRKDMLLQVARNQQKEMDRSLTVGSGTGPGSARDRFLNAASANQEGSSH